MITVANPDIMNVLIDMFNIDSTILIENKDEARQVMANPPVNTKNVKYSDYIVYLEKCA